VSAALEAGALDTDTIIDTGDGKLRVPGKLIEDRNKIGITDAAGVLRHSSNVGAVLIAQELGSERYRMTLERFGFGTSTRSGFPSESAGLMRSWRKWKPVDQANIAFGQGVNVTAIQLAMAVACLANDGKRMRPRLVLAKRKAMAGWQAVPSVSAGQAIEPATARAVMEMLEMTVSAEGTGRRAALAGVRVAGKTGTAQLLDPSGSYSRKRHTAWFVGLVPAEDPKAAIVVALEEPKRGGGGAVAAPLFARVAAAEMARHGIITKPEPIPPAPLPRERMASALDTLEARSDSGNIRPVADLAPATSVRRAPSIAPALAAERANTEAGDRQRTVLIPNFQGVSLTSARSLASTESLELEFSGTGRGWVISQEPAPGTIVGGDQRTVVVIFSARRGDG